MLCANLTPVLVFLSALSLMAVVSALTTLQYDVTTMAANASLNDTDCFCDCEELELANKSLKAPTTEAEAQEAAHQLAAELKVNTANLSSTTRKKISAPDDRPTALGLGAVGVIVIVVVIGSIVALDLTVLIHDIKNAMARVFGWEVEDVDTIDRRRRASRNSRRGQLRGRSDASVVNSHLYAPFQDNVLAEGYEGKAAGEKIGCTRNDCVNVARDMMAGVLPSSGRGGHGGAGDDASTAAPDIKSRRELLEMHGGLH